MSSINEKEFETRDPFVEGLKAFNDKRYFQAHEDWELFWTQLNGVKKTFVQGLIQAAVAAHHRSKGNLNGARTLAKKSLERLAAPAPVPGLTLGPLKDWLAELDSADPGDPPRI